MNILEIKNNLVKIAYNAEDNLILSGFLVIEDSNSPYVAQVMNLKSGADGNFAIAKLLFTFDNEGILKNYNGSIPSVDAKISKIESNELLDIIPVDKPLILGNLAQQDITLRVDKSILENNLLICSNNLYNTEDLLVCLTSQLPGERTVIIDSEGRLRIDKKIVIGEDFKLPLNVEAIDYIYDNDLADIDAVNKAVIQDILIEVQNYIKTLPEKFLPFENFINVIDMQYRETDIPELILLKNKLLKYKDMNIFAENIKDILDLNIAIEKSDVCVIDISSVSDDVQKEVIRQIYSVLNDMDEKVYSFVKINNSNITKRLLKIFIEKNNVYTTIICPHEFKYIEDIKEISQNIIFFAPLTMTHDFASYNTYLNKLNSNEFVVYGAHTQNIPFIVEVIDNIEESIPQKVAAISQEPTEDNINTEEQVTEDENDEYIEEPETEEPIEEEYIPADESVNEPINEENLQEEVIIEEEPLEENYEENGEEDGGVEIVETIDENQPKTQEEIVEQAAKDVDRAFYEKLPSIDEDTETDIIEPSEDDLTEDDLNLIDDLSSDEVPLAGEVTEEPIIEEEVEETPIVPIYPADDIDDRETDDFRAGDRVMTEKYGEGVVEKMIKYGNKMLCSIDFPNIGRRLLDPAITDIKRITD